MSWETKPSMPKREDVLVGVTLAEEWLQTMKINRPLNDERVRLYAQEIKAGRWVAGTGDSIKFNTKGELFDGQHRLWAIIESGMAVWLSVARGCDDESIDVVDCFGVRTTANILSLSSIPYPTTVAGAVRWLVGFANMAGRPFGHLSNSVRGLTPAKIKELLKDEYKELPVLAGKAKNFVAKKRILPPSLLTALLFLFERRDAALAEEFGNSLASGGAKADHPFTLLRERLISNATARRREPSEVMAYYCIKAWNAARLKRNIRQMKVHMDEPLPDII